MCVAGYDHCAIIIVCLQSQKTQHNGCWWLWCQENWNIMVATGQTGASQLCPNIILSAKMQSIGKNALCSNWKVMAFDKHMLIQIFCVLCTFLRVNIASWNDSCVYDKNAHKKSNSSRILLSSWILVFFRKQTWTMKIILTHKLRPQIIVPLCASC